ncbi:hypothetical protein CFT13S00388_10045, partial [Campylobacter fetus subsp. testudinum]|uniref:hypothetical protein n=1 Tax=Campylobacter fetus TaxID=196 RepID=UPI000828B9F8
EELFNATNIAEDKKADAYMKAKICKIWLKNKDKISKMYGAPRERGALVGRGETSFASKTKSMDAFLSYIN